ncbi:MAG: transcriptional regulator GutM [Acidimicrobiia bacterium]
MDGFTIALILAGAWLVQIVASNIQMKRFHATTQRLRKTGTRMAIGLAGSTYRRKVYSAVVIDDNDIVTAAGRLGGFTVAASMRELPEIVGMHLDRVGKGDPPDGIDPKTWASLDHAAEFIRKQIAKERARGGDG